MTGPKINMTVTKIEPGWEKIPMEYGTSVTRKNVTALNSAENRIVEAEINLSEKIIRDVPMPSLEVKKETKTYDLLTGKVIVSNTTSELHGIDTLIKK